MFKTCLSLAVGLLVGVGLASQHRAPPPGKLNSLSLNALTVNAISLNAVTMNSLSLNALTTNAIAANAIVANAASGLHPDSGTTGMIVPGVRVVGGQLVRE